MAKDMIDVVNEKYAGRGQFGKREGIKRPEDEEFVLDEAIKANTTNIMDKPPEGQESLLSTDAYGVMAQRLEEAMGPKERYSGDVLGATQEFFSGLPGGAVPAVEVAKEQEQAAQDLAKMTGAFEPSRPESRPTISAKEYTSLVDRAVAVERINDDNRAITNWLSSRPQIRSRFNGILNAVAEDIKDRFGLQSKKAAVGRANYWKMVNARIKDITGAQMSEPEARRLMREMPNIKNNPEAFLEVWNKIMRDRVRQFQRRYEIAKGSGYRGIAGIEPMYQYSKKVEYSPARIKRSGKKGAAASKKRVDTKKKEPKYYRGRYKGRIAVFVGDGKNKKFVRFED